jgi:hypothetical protein
MPRRLHLGHPRPRKWKYKTYRSKIFSIIFHMEIKKYNIYSIYFKKLKNLILAVSCVAVLENPV